MGQPIRRWTLADTIKALVGMTAIIAVVVIITINVVWPKLTSTALIPSGCQDLFLTSNPEATVFARDLAINTFHAVDEPGAWFWTWAWVNEEVVILIRVTETEQVYATPVCVLANDEIVLGEWFTVDEDAIRFITPATSG